ncbi:SAM-dependent methyltransferase [Phytohabitans flavus]|uniref:SAM-dependent methyltransferase n=1 Tax=Phytohabitans flavus TaxID=1076124 RepID=UPI001E482AEB|nr:SAM-dependent methyltransferase [Phytohabitans flavus]
MAETWVTDDELREAHQRYAAGIPGYVAPAAHGVARKDGDDLTFGHINPPGAARPLPSVVMASVCGYVSTTGVFRLDRERFAEAVARLTPAESATHIPHPNLWTWRELLAGGDADSEFLAFYLADEDDPVVDGDDARFRERFPAPADQPSWAKGVDLSRPSPARVYDYLLGGGHNFASDRALAEQLLAVEPEARRWAAANRSFLGRAVEYLLDAGVRQFIDLGAGIPTVGNVHDIALGATSDARVVYVDVDQVAVTHSRHLVADVADRVGVVQADMRSPHAVLADPETQRLIDFDRPVGILMVAVLHFVSDADDPWAALAAYRDAVPSGSGLVISHISHPAEMTDEVKQSVRTYSSSAAPLTLRSQPEVEALFAGWQLADPGVARVLRWRAPAAADADSTPDIPGLVGVALKP